MSTLLAVAADARKTVFTTQLCCREPCSNGKPILIVSRFVLFCYLSKYPPGEGEKEGIAAARENPVRAFFKGISASC